MMPSCTGSPASAVCILTLILVACAEGFVVPSLRTQKSLPRSASLALSPESILDQHIVHAASSAVDSSSHIISSLTRQVDRETAKGEFYFFFFAGSGAGVIGLAQIPRIFEELSGIRALAGEGPSEGGEAIGGGLSSLIYPTIYAKDVEKAINKVSSGETISKNGKATSYLASRGYVDRDDFVESLKGCNPLASYALFEALSNGSGGVMSPDRLDENVAMYRASSDPVAAFNTALQAATTTKLAAYGGLAFLLFIVFALITESGMNAFL
mmetsp:Transcript_7632/g.15355  ORF Transcript_7632/g.15355 Transcript_7632/m.15355 type:complete len:269 (+) Transcript_7632:1799-2605(+)